VKFGPLRTKYADAFEFGARDFGAEEILPHPKFPPNDSFRKDLCFSPDVFFCFFQREISEMRGPTGVKFCTVVSTRVNFIMPVQNFWGHTPKKFRENCEMRRPIGAKFCTIVNTRPYFIIPVQNFGGGAPQKNFRAQKHAKFSPISDDFEVRRGISPKRMKIFKIGKSFRLWRFVLG